MQQTPPPKGRRTMADLNRRTLFKAAALPALGGLPFRSARAQAGQHHQARRAGRSVRHVPRRHRARPRSPRRARRSQDFGQRGFNVEIVVRRPPEQAGCRRQHRPAMVRPRRRRLPGGCRRPPRSRSRSTTWCGRRTRSTSTARPATSDLTGKHCSPNTVHWTYDTWMLAKSTGGATVQAGGDSWFFITADYAFGHALERDTGELRQGARAARCSAACARPSRRPPDFSSFLLQAQAAAPR